MWVYLLKYWTDLGDYIGKLYLLVKVNLTAGSDQMEIQSGKSSSQHNTNQPLRFVQWIAW
jgi:hypothetical protein